MEKMTYEKAIEIGGTEWKKGSTHRVYFNSMEAKAAIYGIEIKGKDGYIDGEKISRSNLQKVRVSEPFLDVDSGELMGIVKKFSSCAGYGSI